MTKDAVPSLKDEMEAAMEEVDAEERERKAAEKKVWCVKERGGFWCAAANQRRMPHEGASSMEAKCGYLILRRFEVERREPNCPTCQRVLAAAKRARKN